MDGFSDEKDSPDGTLPTMAVEVRIAPSPNVGATMSIVTRFRSIEDMEQLIAMGHEKGIIDALGQVDAVLGAVTAVGVTP